MEKHTLTLTTPSDCELTMTRVFDAQRARVFDAWTNPALLPRWLGVHGDWRMTTCEVDLRPGGRYRYVWTGGGRTMGMGGTFLEVAGPDRLVATEKFDDPWYEGEAVSTLTLVEHDGVTTAANTVRYVSKAVRDGVLRTPMDAGMRAAFETLDGVLASLR